MSAYTHVRVDPPGDWAVFERASEMLWTEILGSGAVKRYGRQGQEQFGLDIVCFRNGDAIPGLREYVAGWKHGHFLEG